MIRENSFFVSFNLCKKIAKLKMIKSNMKVPLYYMENKELTCSVKTGVPALSILDVINNLSLFTELTIGQNTITKERSFICQNGDGRLFWDRNVTKALAKGLIYQLGRGDKK